MGQITERKVRQYSGLAADMASIPAAGKTTGDLYFTTDTKACFRWDGAAWVGPVPALWVTAAMLQTDSVETLKIKDANVTSAKLDVLNKGRFENALLHIQDQKASGTPGGTSVAATWNIRTLNTSLTNEITGASLNANQITLPAGAYFLEASAPANSVNNHKVKLYNVTDVTDTLIGTSEYSRETSYGTNRSAVSGRFTIAAQKVFELRHYTMTAIANRGLGDTVTLGVIEVYSDVKIWKI
jgi:hypothetical protein